MKPVKMPEQLIAEYTALMGDRVPEVYAMTKGAIWGLSAREQAFAERPSTATTWILNGHKGTLEKLPMLLASDRPPTSLELLSAVRNLFENLIWLRLFELGAEWGLRFYGRLLCDQIEDLRGLLSKNEEEAALFRKLAAEDDAIVDATISTIRTLDRSDETTIATLMDEQRDKQAELDARARRSFAIHASVAAFNGYEYQVHLIENKERRRIGERLTTLETRLREFEREIANKALFERYTSKFNWRGEAQRVGMVSEYDYLYRLTSRLLHSTPMNIITEKELIQAERTILLEYMIIGATDAIDIIERYDFPNRVKIAMIEIDEPDGADESIST